MENLHIILLSSVVVVLFIVFIFATLREMEMMEENPYDGRKEGGPRADLLNLIGQLIDEKIDNKMK